MTTQHQQPEIPRFARHLQLRLKLLGLSISQNYVYYSGCSPRDNYRLEFTYGSHNQTHGRHVLHIQHADQNGYTRGPSEVFTEFEAALIYVVSKIPSHNFISAITSPPVMHEHIQRIKKIPPAKKLVSDRQEKMSDELADKADFYLIDRVCDLVNSKENPYRLSSIPGNINPTINLAPKVLGKYKIYIRMITPTELQVSVADPNNVTRRSGQANIIHGSKDHKNAVFNTLLAEPKDVLSYVQEIISTAEKAKKMGVKAPKAV